jgi:hypothetical protein
MKLDLSGADGTRGENGGEGESSECARQPQDVPHNLRAPDGGNGGDGGDGGNGGDGSSLTIYSTNPANLRQIYVVAAAGKPGEGGKGGNGNQGCQCPQPYWTVETCTGKPGSAGYSCTTEEFRCQNGNDGTDGRDGKPGREGKIGSLTLINLNQPLTPDRLAATVPMSELKEKGVALSRNLWETRTGAASLFAPGSIIADRYRELVKRQENSVVLIWSAAQPFADFADKLVTLRLNENQGVDISLPEQIWVESNIQQRSNITEVFISNAIFANQVTQLKNQGLSGSGTELKLDLADEAQRSDVIATAFALKYRASDSDEQFRPVSDYITRYEGELPPEAIRLQDHRFTLYLGRLPIDPKYLAPGLNIELELVATRSFGAYSQEQKIIIRERIPK